MAVSHHSFLPANVRHCITVIYFVIIGQKVHTQLWCQGGLSMFCRFHRSVRFDRISQGTASSLLLNIVGLEAATTLDTQVYAYHTYSPKHKRCGSHYHQMEWCVHAIGIHLFTAHYWLQSDICKFMSKVFIILISENIFQIR